MEMTIQFARMYSSLSQYGETPRTSPPGNPIILDKYPLPEDRSVIYFGAPYDPLFKAISVGIGIGNVMLRGLFPDHSSTMEESVEEALEAGKFSEIESWNWFITILVERQIDVSNNKLLDNKYFWLKPRFVIETEREFKEYARPHVDMLADYISSKIGKQFFEHSFIGDRVFFHSDAKNSFTMPKFQAGEVKMKVTSPMNKLDLESLRDSLLQFTSEGRIELSALSLNTLLDLVETAETSDLKGRVLEELVSKLFETIDGFSVATRVKTETEEIDISVLNDSSDARFRREGAMILVECKNWTDKCGKNEFVILLQKAANRNNRCTLAYLVSWNGFAETVTKEMLRGSHDNILIVPLTGEDIRLAVRGVEFDDILTKAWQKAVNL